MFKIGVGPSSSHTLGPWKAALEWIGSLPREASYLRIYVELYGSLSYTGKGHATDIAVILGLMGKNPELITSDEVEAAIQSIELNKRLVFPGDNSVGFDKNEDIIFCKEFLPFHPNALIFYAIDDHGSTYSATYYSIGGGFISRGETEEGLHMVNDKHPYPIEKAKDLENYCRESGKSIYELVKENELSYMSEHEFRSYLLKIWDVMLDSMFRGCHKEGILPGGLDVVRRAPKMYQKMFQHGAYKDRYEWLECLKHCDFTVSTIFKWVSCFALSVNEENADMGRVVTAPTNGSAGVVPAVLMFYLTRYNLMAGDDEIIEFLSVASEIGCIFKKGATISAAMGGCQAEIGVSSAMAAAGLTHVLGGDYKQVLSAAEMAMEHHLGLTCDPINGLVQVPCIERNSMGAIKAINAAELALDSDADHAKVPLDKVVATMWATALDMNRKYKETSEGGLAIDLTLPEC